MMIFGELFGPISYSRARIIQSDPDDISEAITMNFYQLFGVVYGDILFNTFQASGCDKWLLATLY